MLEVPKQVWSLWNLRVSWENCSFLPPNWLKLDNCVIQGVVSQDQRLNLVKLANKYANEIIGHFTGKWLEILRILNAGMQKNFILQYPGYVRDVGDACCMLQEGTAYFFVRDGSNYIVYHNSKYSKWEILRINALNYRSGMVNSIMVNSNIHWSLWNLRVSWENCSFLPPNWLKLDN